MLETIMSYPNLYYTIPILLFLVLFGYLLRWWYQISYYMYAAVLLLMAFFFGLGYVAVVKYAFSPYLVGGLYAAILVGYLAAKWYHISWKDLIGKFRPTPKTT